MVGQQMDVFIEAASLSPASTGSRGKVHLLADIEGQRSGIEAVDHLEARVSVRCVVSPVSDVLG